MSDLAVSRELAVLYEMPLLVSDSQREFNLVKGAVQQQFAPSDFLEHMWVAELTNAEWETLQLQRFRKEIVTSARIPALRNLLGLILQGQDDDEVQKLADRSITNKAVRRKVEKLLSSYHLTKVSIDAEAFRHSLAELDYINRRLAELASRRDKILRRLEEHRAGLAVPCTVHSGDARQEV
ncbi:hypothetical protein ACRQ5Q_27625 [Bradyrhizobium sp. PMVTL-01]|uniref:hypothetical protein n=1 Tax=Bradyrhizobium sp. PMVTL-01 TaxID=3434999 RepID=UPI003F724005